MKKLFEILGQKPVDGDVGIEIEMEGANFPYEVRKPWRADVDGSLRGENREFILAQPISVKKVVDALTTLNEDLAANKTKVKFSFRTSVHVHVNVQDLTSEQYLNMLYTYLLLEEPLMTYCGKERKGNRFCLRAQDAEGMLGHFSNMFRHGVEGIYDVPQDQIRYSAINIEATKKYGSLEFRGMRGTLDVDILTTWVNALWAIKEFAKSVDNPTEVYNLYSQLEPAGFINHVLKDLADAFTYPKMVKDVQRSFSLSLDLPFSFRKVEPKKKENPHGDLAYRQKTALAHMKLAKYLPLGYLEEDELPKPPAGKVWDKNAHGRFYKDAPVAAIYAADPRIPFDDPI